MAESPCGNDPAARPHERLAGQTALVTGAARRVGACIARALHAAGANVVIHCRRSLDAAEHLAAELDAARPHATAVIACDLLNAAQLPRLIEQTRERFGALHLLINNASSFYATPLGSTPAAQWAILIGTILRAPLFLAQAAAAD